MTDFQSAALFPVVMFLVLQTYIRIAPSIADFWRPLRIPVSLAGTGPMFLCFFVDPSGPFGQALAIGALVLSGVGAIWTQVEREKQRAVSVSFTLCGIYAMLGALVLARW